MDRLALGDKMLARRRREELFDPGTVAVLERVGIGPGWSCLEVGAGLGSIALGLARRVHPTGAVVATDVRGDYLDVLHALDEPGLEVVRHDVVIDPIARVGYDLIHARFVLEHLPEREAVVAKLVSALKPGGWIVLEDVDFATCLADRHAPYARAMGAFVAAMAMTGTDYDWARRLPDVLQAIGLQRIDATGSGAFFRGASVQAQYWAAQWLDVEERLVSEGLLSADEVEDALRVVADPNRWFAPPLVVTVSGAKAE